MTNKLGYRGFTLYFRDENDNLHLYLFPGENRICENVRQASAIYVELALKGMKPELFGLREEKIVYE